MDLLKATPTDKAKFRFLSPVDGKPVCTDKGTEMYVNVFGAHSKEYQAAVLEKHRRTVSILEKHELKGDDKITPECQKDLDDSDLQLQCDITISLLVQIGDKEVKSKKDFYTNPELKSWVVEIAKFANSTANFIKA